MPGYHSPQNPIELLAGLEIRATGALSELERTTNEAQGRP
ncbi:MAG: hypothetical protein JWP15_2229 [Alphaproteobacteria bacterium]|nr:hypothetical protein [Alphaproteobacteria bacterium]